MKKLLLLLPLALLCGCAREPSPVSALALDRATHGPWRTTGCSPIRLQPFFLPMHPSTAGILEA